MNIKTKVDSSTSAGTKDHSEQKVEDLHVCQHSSKFDVSGLCFTWFVVWCPTELQ
ncbi:MAG: hypothetical protein ABIO76_05410 [Ginsengibacter sp.]